MLGRRVKADQDGWLKGLVQYGDYGRLTRTPEQVCYHLEKLHWQVITPAGEFLRLSPYIHTVVEHADGSITVFPEIVTDGWSGVLRAGTWESSSK